MHKYDTIIRCDSCRICMIDIERKALGMADYKILSGLGELKQFSKNQTVFFQNETGDDMYIVLKGIFGVFINTFTGFPSRVAEIKQGSFFGEMSVIDGSPRSATITSEDDSSVIIINKKNFSLLLESAPDIASGMMDTMRNRATATVEAVRKSGKKVPDLPPILKIVKYRDAESSLSFLTMLAEKIREMNTLLVTATEAEAGKETGDIVFGDSIKLLPDDYVKYDQTDLGNNKDNLRVASVVCPYCCKSLNANIPVFSSLIKSKETLDGRVIYSNLNILLYTNTVCPNCNYTDTYLEFSKPRASLVKPRYEGNQFKNEEGFTGYDRSGNRSVDEAILSYYLNIDCLKRTTGDPLRFANAWIRLHWLFNDQKSISYAKNAAKNAKYYFAKYAELNSKTLNDNDKMRLFAILGEMSVALDDNEGAVKYFSENLVLGKNTKNDLYKESKNRIDGIKKSK